MTPTHVRKTCSGSCCSSWQTMDDEKIERCFWWHRKWWKRNRNSIVSETVHSSLPWFYVCATRREWQKQCRNNAEKRDRLGSQGNQENSVDIHGETLRKQRKVRAIKITRQTQTTDFTSKLTCKVNPETRVSQLTFETRKVHPQTCQSGGKEKAQNSKHSLEFTRSFFLFFPWLKGGQS